MKKTRMKVDQKKLNVYYTNRKLTQLLTDGDVQDEDAEYLEFLANQKIQENSEDSDDEIEEEILYESPLDQIDPYECFEQVFRGKFTWITSVELVVKLYILHRYATK